MDSHLALREGRGRVCMSSKFDSGGEGREGKGRTAGPRDAMMERERNYSSDDDQRTLNEPRNVLPYERDTLTMRISSDGADFALELLGTSNDIFGERISCQLSESWPFHQRRYLFHSNPRIPEKRKKRKRKSQIIRPNIDREKGTAHHHQAPRNTVRYLPGD